MMVPTSILIGFEGRHRFVYTDGSTGIIKVIDQPNLASQNAVCLAFMNSHMQPLHYGAYKNTTSKAPQVMTIAPRFILKILKSDFSTTSQVYFCDQSLLSDAWKEMQSYDIVIQQFICSKSCKPSIFRFYANQSTVYKAQCIASPYTFSQQPEAIKRAIEICERIKENKVHEYDRYLRQKGLLQNKVTTGNHKKPLLYKSKSLSQIKVPISWSIVQNNEKGIHYFIRILSKMPSQATMAKEGLDIFIERLYMNFQNSFDQFEKNNLWTVESSEKDFSNRDQQISKLMPSAYKVTIDSVNKLIKLFGIKLIASKHYGFLKSGVVDFIEGESGRLYFIKIKQFDAANVQTKQWKISSNFKNSISEQNTEYQFEGCKTKILCQNLTEVLKRDFVQKCKEKGLWNFKIRQCSDQIPERLVYLYRLELLFAMDQFNKFQEKKVQPFFPLICFPDKYHRLYYIYKQQMLTSVDMTSKVEFHQLFASEFSRGLTQKFARSLKEKLMVFQQEAIQNKELLNYGVVKGRQAKSLLNFTQFQLKKDESHKMQVNDQGEIVASKFSKEIKSCLLCTQLLKLYSQRHRTIVFQLSGPLNKLKKKQLSEWDADSTDLLLNFYAYGSAEKKQFFSSDKEKQKVNSNWSFTVKPTESSSQRQKETSEFVRSVKFKTAVMKLNRFRNQPDKVTNEDIQNIQSGPTVEKERIQKHYNSLKNTTRRDSERTLKSYSPQKLTTENLETMQSKLINKSLVSSVSSDRSSLRNISMDSILINKRHNNEYQGMPRIEERLKRRRLRIPRLDLKELALSPSGQLFRFKMTQQERQLNPVKKMLKRMVFDAPIGVSPYIRQFQSLGFKLQRVKRSQSVPQMSQNDQGFMLPKLVFQNNKQSIISGLQRPRNIRELQNF